MKRLIFIIAFLITAISFAQGGPKVDVLKFRGKVTTTVRNTIDVPAGETHLIHNVTTNTFQWANSDDVWKELDTDDQTASEVSSSPFGGISSSDVQAALQELDTEKVSLVQDNLVSVDFRIGSSAQSGTYISLDHNSNSVSIGSSNGTDNSRIDVQPEGIYLSNFSNAEIDAIGADAALTKDYGDTNYLDNTDDQTASEVPFTPNGNIAATNVQDAIVEVRDEASGSGLPTTTNYSTLLTDFPSPSDGDAVYVTGDFSNHGIAGVFVYNSAESATDDGGVVKNGWVRRFDGAVDIKWFSTSNDGVTDDLAAFNAATAYLTQNGGTLFISNGYYGLSGTWNIGLLEYTNYDFMVDRTAPTKDVEFDANDIPANKILNRDNYEAIDIVFDKGAFLVANWSPSSPEPVLAYHLKTDRDKGGKAKILNPQIISADVFSSGVHDPLALSSPADNNLIGLYYFHKVGEVKNVLVSGIEYGIVQGAPYWSSLSNVKIEWAKEGINSLFANATVIDNVVIWNSDEGLIFNGEASNIRNFHTEEVGNDMWIMDADVCNFVGAYFEDVTVTDGTGNYFLRLGHTENGNEVRHSSFQGFRAGASRPNKEGLRAWSSRNVTFESFRLLSKGFTVDNVSDGFLMNTDFEINDNFLSNFYLEDNITDTESNFDRIENSILSDNIITNGTFDDATGWNVSAPASISGGTANFVNGAGNEFMQLEWSGAMTIGKDYKIEYDVISTNGNDLTNGPANDNWPTSTVGPQEKYFTAVETSLKLKRLTASTDVSIDNLVLREVYDNQQLTSGVGGSDDQTIDVLNLNGTTLELSLEDDGQATQTVDLSPLGGTPADGSITTVKLSDDAVTTAKILNGTIQAADIQDGTIGQGDMNPTYHNSLVKVDSESDESTINIGIANDLASLNAMTTAGNDVVFCKACYDISSYWDTNNGTVVMNGEHVADDTSVDEANWTFNDFDVGEEITIHADRTTDPTGTLSGDGGITFNKLSYSEDYASGTAQVWCFRRRVGTTIIDYFITNP